MLVLQFLVGLGVFLVGSIFLQLAGISKKVKVVSQQLEYLGAPLEVQGETVVAKRRSRTRWIVTSEAYGDGHLVHYIAPDEGRSYEPPEN